MNKLKRTKPTKLLVLLSLILFLNPAYAQSQQANSPCSTDYEPVLVVEGLWNSASSGELLNPKGWARATSTRYFTQSGSTLKDSSFRVVDNRYGITDLSKKEDGKLLITVETAELGRIDSELRFIPTRHDNPDFFVYRMVYGATPEGMWTTDGKKLLKQTITMTGPKQWRIEGPLAYRWATVNAAILYVMETRDKSKDPVLRQNAEKTLEALRKFR